MTFLRRNGWTLIGILLATLVLVGPALEAVQAQEPEFTLKREEVRDDMIFLSASLTDANGDPVQGAKVKFFVERVIDDLPVGTAETWKDGVASVDFPGDVPGDKEGRLEVIAKVLSPSDYEGLTTEATVEGGKPLKTKDHPERKMWTEKAPWTLLLSIGIALFSVWGIYFYIVFQLFMIHREGSQVASS